MAKATRSLSPNIPVIYSATDRGGDCRVVQRNKFAKRANVRAKSR